MGEFAGLFVVFMGSLLAGFYLLARATSPPVYRKVTIGLALGPAAVWFLLGLGSSQLGFIAAMAAGLAGSILALAWIAARLAGTAPR